MKKKILIINTNGLAVGGITTHIYNYLSTIIPSCDYEVTMVVTVLADESVIEKFREMGCLMVYMPHRQRELCQYVSKLYKLMKGNMYDVVHVHGSSSTIAIELFVAKLLNVPVRIAHSHNSTCDHPMLNKVLKPLLKYSLTKAVACSGIAGQWLFGHDNFIVLHNAFLYTPFLFSDEIRKNKRKELDVSDDCLLLGSVGNLIEQKNIIFLLPIMKNLNANKINFKFLVIGNGEQRYSLEDFVEKEHLQDTVCFLGIRNDVKQLLQAIDVFLMPSLWEGLPVALLEAQAAGCRCLVSEKITQEVALGENIKFLPLEHKCWTKEICMLSSDKFYYDRKNVSAEVELNLSKDYNVKAESRKLISIYNG